MHENDVPSDIHCGLILDYFSILQRSSLNTAHECIEIRARRYNDDLRGTMLQIYNEKRTIFHVSYRSYGRVLYGTHSKISLTLSESTVVITLLNLKPDIFYKSSLTFIGLATKWLGGNDKIRDHLVAEPIILTLTFNAFYQTFKYSIL